MSEETARGVEQRYGSAALAALPDQVVDRLRAWGLTPMRPLPGGRTAAVIEVRSRCGPAVLKVAPDGARLHREPAALEALARTGAGPCVYASADLRLTSGRRATQTELEPAACLLELVGDGRSLRELGRAAPGEDALLVDLLARVRASGRVETDATGPGLPHLYDHLAYRLEGSALELLDHLTGSATPGTWVHGSLHPANIVPGGGRLWALDPRPMVGDPAYDVAEVALKRFNERAGRPERALPDDLSSAEEFAGAVGEEPARVVAWMRVLSESES